MEEEGYTIGEIGRAMSGVRSDLKELSKDVVELKVANGTVVDKTRRLEAIVYGSLATATAGLITAVTTALTK